MTLLEQLVRDKMYHHPLPWTVEYDWCVEVWDSGSPERIVLKLYSDHEARELIAMAERLDAESHAFHREFEDMIDASAAG